MPKFPPIPRLSIVIPIGRDLAAFESTLISVLENPVDGSEILVCHDGSYQDPFELGDEIRFVVADSKNPLELISAGASQARGRFVHVLSDGLQATSGWTEKALEEFEAYDCGVVAPVIRHDAEGTIVSAGWSDAVGQLCKSRQKIANSGKQPTGAYLQASFWRRELLRSLTDALTTADWTEASYAFHHLACQAGWKSSLARDSELLYAGDSLPWNKPSVTRGVRTQCIKNHFSGGGWTRTLSAALWAAFASLTRPRQMVEVIGRALAPSASARLDGRLRPNEVASCNQHETIVSTTPQTQVIEQYQRRAA